jgi:hypothetical protein
MSQIGGSAMIHKFSPVVLLLSFVCVQANAQPRVDARNTYERVMAIVPLTGKGTFDDPKRPMYAPSPAELQASMSTRQGILGFMHVMSDDGQFALVEFVARDRAAFQHILADPSVKSFLKGRDKRQDIEAEFLKHKKDFDFAHFGVRMP